MNHHKQHNRRSIRLQGHDYSSPGEYFITICTQNRECLLGDVVKGKMILNECGSVATEFWHKIPDRFNNAVLDAFVVMPNHIHGIIGIEYDPGNDSHPVGEIHELPLQVLDCLAAHSIRKITINMYKRHRTKNLELLSYSKMTASAMAITWNRSPTCCF